jgi:hypothetical protein
MATTRQIVPNHDAKHAVAQTTETLEASTALSTSVRNAKARSVQKGTIRTTAPRFETQFARTAEKLVTLKSDAQRGRVLHAVVERTGFQRTLSVPSAMRKATIARTAQTIDVTHAVFLGTYRTTARL